MIGTLRALSPLLADHGLSMQVRVSGRVVAECGAGAGSSLLALFGLRWVRLRGLQLWVKYLLTGA
jgi:hypothetical protein